MRTAIEVAKELQLEINSYRCSTDDLVEVLTAFRNEGIEEAEKIIEQASAMPVFGLECSQYVASVFKDLLNKIRALKK